MASVVGVVGRILVFDIFYYLLKFVDGELIVLHQGRYSHLVRIIEVVFDYIRYALLLKFRFGHYGEKTMGIGHHIMAHVPFSLKYPDQRGHRIEMRTWLRITLQHLTHEHRSVVPEHVHYDTLLFSKHLFLSSCFHVAYVSDVAYVTYVFIRLAFATTKKLVAAKLN